MSAGLLATPAELRTTPPREGREVGTYPLCECIQVPVCVYACVQPWKQTPSEGGSIYGDKKATVLPVFSELPNRCTISLPLALIRE